MKKIILFIFLTFNILKAGNNECYDIYIKYNLDPNIKAIKGWRRICDHDKLDSYLSKNIAPTEKEKLCKCLSSGVNNILELYVVNSFIYDE